MHSQSMFSLLFVLPFFVCSVFCWHLVAKIYNLLSKFQFVFRFYVRRHQICLRAPRIQRLIVSVFRLDEYIFSVFSLDSICDEREREIRTNLVNTRDIIHSIHFMNLWAVALAGHKLYEWNQNLFGWVRLLDETFYQLYCKLNGATNNGDGKTWEIKWVSAAHASRIRCGESKFKYVFPPAIICMKY